LGERERERESNRKKEMATGGRGTTAPLRFHTAPYTLIHTLIHSVRNRSGVLDAARPARRLRGTARAASTPPPPPVSAHV
jgi:hypothetical protein